MFQETNYKNLSMNKHQAPQLNTGRDHVDEQLNKQELHLSLDICGQNLNTIKQNRKSVPDLIEYILA